MNKTSINDLFDLEENYNEYENENYNAIRSDNDIQNKAQYLQTERYNYDNYDKYSVSPQNPNLKSDINTVSYTQKLDNSDEIANYIAQSYKLAEFLKKHDKEAYKIASKFYYCDNTFLIIAVIILSITTLLLIKRVIKL